MAKVSSAKSSSKPKATKSNKSGAKKTAQKSQPKSADVKSTQPSERAKDIARNNEIKDGVFKSRSDATVGDIAQANSLKDDGTVDTAKVQQQVKDIVSNNPALADKAKELGIDLENPTEEDLQKLADLDVKAGQEVKVGEEKEAKETGEAAPGEEPQEEEAPEESGGGGGGSPCSGADGPQGAQDDKQNGNPLSEIMDLINKAESATDPFLKAQYADDAISKINALRSEKGVKRGQGQGQDKKSNSASSKLVNTIKSGGKVSSDNLESILSKAKPDDLANILDALESRAIKAKNGNNNILNGMNLQAQKNVLNLLGMGNYTLPYTNFI